MTLCNLVTVFVETKIVTKSRLHCTIFFTYLRISHKGFCGIWIDISVPAISVEFPLDWLYLRIIECCINYFFAIRGYPNGIITLQYVLWKCKKNKIIWTGSIASSFWTNFEFIRLFGLNLICRIPNFNFETR